MTHGYETPLSQPKSLQRQILDKQSARRERPHDAVFEWIAAIGAFYLVLCFPLEPWMHWALTGLGAFYVVVGVVSTVASVKARFAAKKLNDQLRRLPNGT